MRPRGTGIRDEAGFSLVEVILAMVIIAGVMATAAGIVVSGLTTITQARQRQTATALATQAIERLRALPYDTISLANAAATPDATATYAVLDGGQYYLRTALPNLTLDERLIVNAVSGRTANQTVDEVTYRVHTYVSLAPLTAGGQQAFNLTAIVVYTSNVSRGQRITAQRSVAFSPSGCLSTAQNPFAAPCQSYFTANAGQALGGITISNPLDSTLPILGFDAAGGTLLELGLASNSATVLVEQTATGNSGATTSGARQVAGTESSTGSVTASAAVDSDPSSTPGQEAVNTTAGQTSSQRTLTGTAGSLVATPNTSDSGRAAAAVFADLSYCVGVDGNGLVTGPDASHLRPCASSYVQPAGSTATMSFLPNSPGGFSSMTIPLVTSAAASTAARAVAAQLAGNVPPLLACTYGTGPGNVGCAYAEAKRVLGDVRIVDPTVGATVPAGFDAPGGRGLVRVAGLTEAVRTEEGQGARIPQYTRAGTLSLWNGTGYTTVNLGTYATPAGVSGNWTIPPTDIVYVAPSTKLLTIRYEGTVTVTRPQQTFTPATRTGNLVADCKAQSCVSQLNGGGAVIVNLTASVIEGGTEIARFGIAANLGGLIGQATYRAAADA